MTFKQSHGGGERAGPWTWAGRGRAFQAKQKSAWFLRLDVPGVLEAHVAGLKQGRGREKTGVPLLSCLLQTGPASYQPFQFGKYYG